MFLVCDVSQMISMTRNTAWVSETSICFPHTRMANCSFRILNREEQTRVIHFIQLIFCPLFSSALRADGSNVSDVHHLKPSQVPPEWLSSGLSLSVQLSPALWWRQHCWMKGAGAGSAMCCKSLWATEPAALNVLQNCSTIFRSDNSVPL